MELIDIQEYIANFKNPRKWSHIIIHHSLTKDGNVNDWSAITNYHKNVMQFADCGYHAGLEIVDGSIVYQVGRPLDLQGAHTLGMNDRAIGICIVGNFDIVAPSNAHYFLTANLCKAFMGRFGIPSCNVLPHREYAYKTCPGKLFDMIRLRNEIS